MPVKYCVLDENKVCDDCGECSVCDLDPNKVNERILLMPGEYQLVVKPQSSIDYKDVRTMRFQIGSGKTTNIDLSK